VQVYVPRRSGVAPSMATHARAQNHPWFCSGYIHLHMPSRTSIHRLHSSNPAREGQEHTPYGVRFCVCSCRCFACKSKKLGQRIVCAEGYAYACSPPSTAMDGRAHGRGSPWMAPPPTGGGEHACACPSARPKRRSPASPLYGRRALRDRVEREEMVAPEVVFAVLDEAPALRAIEGEGARVALDALQAGGPTDAPQRMVD